MVKLMEFGGGRRKKHEFQVGMEREVGGVF